MNDERLISRKATLKLLEDLHDSEATGALATAALWEAIQRVRALPIQWTESSLAPKEFHKVIDTLEHEEPCNCGDVRLPNGASSSVLRIVQKLANALKNLQEKEARHV